MDEYGIKSTPEYVDISIFAVLRLMMLHRIVVAAVTLLSIAASIAVAYLSTPAYSSTVLISPASAGSAIPNVVSQFLASSAVGGALSQIGNSLLNTRDISLSALSSPYFTRSFIDEYQLMPLLFDDKWDKAKGNWKSGLTDDIPTLTDAYELFSKKVVRISENPQTGLVTVTVQWKDPELAANWANSLVAFANRRLQTQAIRDSDLTIDYLNQELAKTNTFELQQSIYKSIQSEIQSRTVASVREDYAFKVLSPAIPADIDKPDRPNRAFIISVGVVLGLIFSVVISIILGPIDRARITSPDQMLK